jgi:hypothetical protein
MVRCECGVPGPPRESGRILCGCMFEIEAGPGGPGKPSKRWVASPPLFFTALLGPWARLDFKNAPPKTTNQIAFRYPQGPRIDLFVD